MADAPEQTTVVETTEASPTTAIDILTNDHRDQHDDKPDTPAAATGSPDTTIEPTGSTATAQPVEPIKAVSFEEKKKSPYRITSVPELLRLLNKGVPVVFLGGQMSTFDPDGTRRDITDREQIRHKLEEIGVCYYDPSLGEPQKITASRDISSLDDFQRSRLLDKTAVLLSRLLFVSIGEESIGTISILECLFSLWVESSTSLISNRVVSLVDAESIENFKFAPPGIEIDEHGSIDFEKSNPGALRRHLFEAMRAGNLMRAEFLKFIKETQSVKTHDPNDTAKVRIVSQVDDLEKLKKENPSIKTYHISANDMHIFDLISIFREATNPKSTQEIAIYFDQYFAVKREKPQIPSDQIHPTQEPPIMYYHILEPRPGEVMDRELTDIEKKLLQQYYNDGNAIRHLMIDQIQESSNTTIAVKGQDAIGMVVEEDNKIKAKLDADRQLHQERRRQKELKDAQERERIAKALEEEEQKPNPNFWA